MKQEGWEGAGGFENTGKPEGPLYLSGGQGLGGHAPWCPWRLKAEKKRRLMERKERKRGRQRKD